MPASATDKFKKVAPNTGWQIGGGGVDASVTTIPLVSATSLPTGTGVILTIDRVDSSGALTPTKMERVVGAISGSNVISCVRGIGGTAQAHSAGAVVEIVIDSVLWNDLMDGILVGHGQDGSHLPNLPLTTPILNTPSIIGGWNGWVSSQTIESGTNAEVWTASDANTISVNRDITSRIQKGDKLKLTNNSAVKYFYVSTTPVYATGATTFDVTGEVDLVAGAITLPYFSKIDNPQGFKKGEMYFSAKFIRATDQSGIVDSVLTVLTPTVTEYDKNSMISGDRITAPVSGRYKVNAWVTASSSTNKLAVSYLYIQKNDYSLMNTISAVGTYDGWYFTNYYSSEIYLNKGDYLRLAVLNDTIDSSISSARGELGLSFVSV